MRHGSMLRAALLVASASAVTPVQKVIQMLNDMSAKGQREMKAEQETFAKFTSFCEETDSEKMYAIRTSLRLMEEASAAMMKNKQTAAAAGRKIAELQKAIGQAEQELADAVQLRAGENEDFNTQLTDYTETLVAIERAMVLLKKQDYSRAQALGLIQEIATLRRLPVGSAKALMNYFNGVVEKEAPKTAFMSQQAPYEGQPEVQAYTSHMGGIIDMLSDMQVKVQGQKSQLEKEEANKQHAHMLLSADLTSQKDYDNKQMNRKLLEKSEALELLAQATADFEQSTANKNADTKYKSDLKAACQQKSDDFMARQKLRKEELEALTKATDIIASQSLQGKADKHLPALVEVKPHSFLQTESNTGVAMRKKTLNFLQEVAKRLDSSALSLAATAVAADPFAKVKDMVRKLIQRLKDEAKKEADAKAWCDKNLHDNKLTREEKTAKFDSLTAAIEGKNALITKLGNEITDLSQDLADNEKALKEATDVRTAEKAKNEETIADAKEAQAAVQAAVVVLKEFYGNAAGATALLQSKGVEDDLPSTWSAPYKGQQDGNSGIMGMLEVIDSDFARLEAETSSSEQEAATAYAAFKEETEADTKLKYSERLQRQRTQKQEKWENSRLNKDLKQTTTALDKANDTYAALKEQCIETGLSYKDRVAKRQEEIESLKQAMEYLKAEE